MINKMINNKINKMINNKIIKMINNRGFQIKNALDWLKFSHGTT